jgi:hypothetical protein
MIRSMLKILTALAKHIWPDTTTSLNLIVTDRLVRLHVSFTTKEASSSRTQISVQCTNRITGDDVQGCLGRFTSLMTVQLGKQAYERWDGAQLESTELLGYVSLLGGVADAVSVSPQEPHLVIAATVFGPEEADQEQAVSRISAAVLGQQDFTLRVVNH